MKQIYKESEKKSKEKLKLMKPKHHIWKDNLSGAIADKAGFTLIELIVVMAIIAILVLLAAPKFLNKTQQAKVVNIKSDVKVVEGLVEEYLIQHDTLPANGVEKSQADLEALDIYDTTGPTDTVNEGPYKLIGDGVLVPANTQLKGNFYGNDKGKVYYDDNTAVVVVPESGDPYAVGKTVTLPMAFDYETDADEYGFDAWEGGIEMDYVDAGIYNDWSFFLSDADDNDVDSIVYKVNIDDYNYFYVRYEAENNSEPEISELNSRRWLNGLKIAVISRDGVVTSSTKISSEYDGYQRVYLMADKFKVEIGSEKTLKNSSNSWTFTRGAIYSSATLDMYDSLGKIKDNPNPMIDTAHVRTISFIPRSTIYLTYKTKIQAGDTTKELIVFDDGKSLTEKSRTYRMYINESDYFYMKIDLAPEGGTVDTFTICRKDGVELGTFTQLSGRNFNFTLTANGSGYKFDFLKDTDRSVIVYTVNIPMTW